jgi:hypothetical protein
LEIDKEFGTPGTIIFPRIPLREICKNTEESVISTVLNDLEGETSLKANYVILATGREYVISVSLIAVH